MRAAWVFLLLCATAVTAAAAPPAPSPSQSKSQIDRWFADLAKAQSPEDAKPIEDKLNAMFRASGSPSVDLLMTRVQQSLSASDNATARKLAVAVTGIAPKYAEGWHVRAAIAASANDDTDALLSLQKAVLLNPRNFEALTELAGMVEDYGDKKTALKLYRQALDVDPQLEAAKGKVRELTTSVEGRDI